MFTIEQIDESTPFMAQLQEETGPIVLINTFKVPQGTAELEIKTWQSDADFMRAQPGFISAQLHQGTGSSLLLTNVSVWESTAALRAAFTSPGFQEKASSYPDGIVVYPHIYRKLAVEGVCVA